MKKYLSTESFRSWAEIDLNGAKFNFTQVKKRTSAKVCAVVKADGYGHGAVQLSNLYQKLGADYLAVATIEEGITLRENGVTLPILILGYTPPTLTETLYVYDLTQTVFSFDYALNLIYNGKKQGVKIKTHVKIESGMNRLGFLPTNKSVKQILTLARSPYLIIEGAFSHFSKADWGIDGKEHTKAQAQTFLTAVQKLERGGLQLPLKHISNSAGILDYPEYHFDMVRAGIILYGLNPSDKIINPIDLKPVMQVYSKIATIKKLAKGQSVSYGGKFVTNKKTTLATIPFGYADGLFRSSENYHFIVNGKVAPIVGTVCMDQTIIDVTGISAKDGDTVTIIGNHPDCSADTLAKLNNTINYEITCAISSRIPRIYV